MGKSRHQTHRLDKELSDENKNVHKKKSHTLKPIKDKKWNKYLCDFEDEDSLNDIDIDTIRKH